MPGPDAPGASTSPDTTWFGSDLLWHSECEQCGARHSGSDEDRAERWRASHACPAV